MTGTFQGFFQGTLNYSTYLKDLNHYTLYFVYLAIAEFFTIYIATAGWLYVGEHISSQLRERYLAAIMRQNIGYFDKLGAGEITTRITSDTNLVQDGISEKVAMTVTALSTFFTAFVIGFIRSWKFTLILFSTVVAIVLSMGGSSTFIVKYSKLSLAAYARGGTVAEEVLSSIRNAVAFGTQEKLARQYNRHLTDAEYYGVRMRLSISALLALIFTIVYLNYGLAFWQGSRFLVAGEISLESILIILLSVIIGAFALGQVAPDAQAFTSAVAAAVKIFSTIQRVSPLDPSVTAGKKLDHVEGVVELRNVKHIYPSRPEITVIENFNLVVPAGKTTALVGASGSGKSTIVGLVERFYSPVGGEVLLDGHNINTLNLRWLRQQMSLVSQEPTLFSTTIYANIRHGLIGSPFENDSEEKQRELIISAAKMSNAHDFVSGLPEGYETHVGERGFLLSGGQKQRIAIARAVVSDPKILLLDEATSALDTKSEGVVQAALDAAARGRTTIVIAHRLSTIKTADNIVVMSNGHIVEQGTHDELIDRRGAYYNLVEAQRIAANNEERAAGDTDENDTESSGLEKPLSRTLLPHRTKSNTPADLDDARLDARLDRSQTAQSASSVALQSRKPEEASHYSLWTLIKVIGRFNRQEWHWTLFGLFSAIIAGAGNPVQAVFFAKAVAALSLPPVQYRKLRDEANFWSLMYLMLAFVMFLAFAGQGVFAYTAERLIHRARERAFRTILRQDIAFFDKKEHSSGALTSFLSTETTHLASLSGVTFGTIMTAVTTLVGAVALGIAFSWKLGLVCTATLPILLACGYFRFALLVSFENMKKTAYEGSASYACEATSAIRTVAALTREADVRENYHRSLVAQGKRSLRANLSSSTLYAASQSFVFLCNALGFWYGGRLIGRGEISILAFFVCFTAIIFGAQSAGTIFSFAGDMSKARQAANELLRLFDRKPSIDTWSQEGERTDDVEGYIEFRDVHFRYPTRPEQPVLRGLNLAVKPGQYVALVGASGCGKSTTIALLERFYDPLAGSVLVDGRDISKLQVNDYRRHLALVSQEPTLYQGSIRDNIVLGADHDDVPEEAIVQACKDANIYDFIMSLP